MAKVDKGRLASIAKAASKVKKSDVFEVPTAHVRQPEPKGFVAAQRGARTGWNPEAAKPSPVRTYAPGAGLPTEGFNTPATPPAVAQQAVMEKAKASRRASAPKTKYPSETAGKKPVSAERVSYSVTRESPSSAAQRAFIGAPAKSPSWRPSRASSSFKPGSAADMAYTGVKPKAAAPRAKKTPAPVPKAPAKPVPPAKPRMVGKALGAGLLINAGQAAYYEYQKRKNKSK